MLKFWEIFDFQNTSNTIFFLISEQPVAKKITRNNFFKRYPWLRPVTRDNFKNRNVMEKKSPVQDIQVFKVLGI